MLQRQLVKRTVAEPDARRKLAMHGEHLTRSAPCHVPVQLLVRAAASSDQTAAEVWGQMTTERLTGRTAFARHLHEGGHLRPRVSVDEGHDVLWTYNPAELYELLVMRRDGPQIATARGSRAPWAPPCFRRSSLDEIRQVLTSQ